MEHTMQKEEILRLSSIMARQMDGAVFSVATSANVLVGRVQPVNVYEYRCEILSQPDNSVIAEITGPDTTVLRVKEVR
jgi:hypothetical protein